MALNTTGPRSDRKKGGLTLDALALHVSPAVRALNPNLFPYAAPTADHAAPAGLPASVTQSHQSQALDDHPPRESRSAASSPLRLGRPQARVLVRYTFRIAGTLRDWDNAYGSTKLTTDALVALGVLPNDSPDDMALEVVQERVAHRCDEGTLIEVLPMGNPIAARHGGV